MSTAQQERPQSRPAQEPQEPSKRPAPGLLDDVLEATQKRVQSIRSTAAMFLGVPPAKVCDLLRNVWHTSRDQPPLTDQEMFVGMSMIARFGLDPIAREVYVTRTKQGLATIIGIDGWIKILDRCDDYDGFEQEEVYKDEGKTLEAIITRIHSKRRTYPAVYKARAVEYGKLSGFMAEKIPAHMLSIFSLRHAARLFTPIGGSVVTEEEARWMNAYEGVVEEDKPDPGQSKTERVAEAAKARRQKTKPTEMEKPQQEVVRPPADEDDPLRSESQEHDFDQVYSGYLDAIDNCESVVAFGKLRDEIGKCDLPEENKTSLFGKIEVGIIKLRGARGDRSNG